MFRKAASLVVDAKVCYKENGDKALVGVYNIKTGEIFLFPCIEERVWLELDTDKGEFVKAWQAVKDKNGSLKRGNPVSDSDVAQYNLNPYAPRVVSFSGKKASHHITSHEYFLTVLGEEKNKGSFRGFSVTPAAKPEDSPRFAWDSMSLNSIFRMPGFKKMNATHQKEVKEIIERWDQPQSEKELSDEEGIEMQEFICLHK